MILSGRGAVSLSWVGVGVFLSSLALPYVFFSFSEYAIFENRQCLVEQITLGIMRFENVPVTPNPVQACSRLSFMFLYLSVVFYFILKFSKMIRSLEVPSISCKFSCSHLAR